MRKYLFIALPVIIVLLLVINLGLAFRKPKTTNTVTSTSTPTPKSSPGTETIFSRVGTIKAVNTEKGTTYYVVLPSEEAVKLEFPNNIKPVDFVGKKVLVSGKYDQANMLLRVENISLSSE
jgi:hypothetical protein